MIDLASQIIIKILIQEMTLDPETIWIRDQNRKIPDGKGLYFAVGMVGAPTIICNVTSMEAQTVDAVITQHEINQVQQREDIMIDIIFPQ